MRKIIAGIMERKSKILIYDLIKRQGTLKIVPDRPAKKLY